MTVETHGFDECQICGATAVELCHDGTCRPCHKTCSWEECVTRTYDARIALRNSIDPERVREMYPDADLSPPPEDWQP